MEKERNNKDTLSPLERREYGMRLFREAIHVAKSPIPSDYSVTFREGFLNIGWLGEIVDGQGPMRLGHLVFKTSETVVIGFLEAGGFSDVIHTDTLSAVNGISQLLSEIKSIQNIDS